MLPTCCGETGMAATEPGPAAVVGSAWRDWFALGACFPVRPNVPHSSLSRWLPSIITALTSKTSTGEYMFLKPASGNTRVIILFAHRSQRLGATWAPQRGKQLLALLVGVWLLKL